ncbi:hypothetical protein Q4566_16250 [Tamlana sp. 2_MG-2023]|uniref:hypothetical protein n=1 Tax=unclassified Tamlana TaxID=2614803 RepID=UPI0026E17F5A|nr:MULTISPECIES: hypothetical protein [unclassified Tamlana]MDO6761761.1 hypothetical protein [Tamlana sp. 2_MG-2023]MDO6792522.1 hypothetical protein [Tamlana sp. 1_MG-2023]
MIFISKKYFRATTYMLLCDMLIGIFIPSFNGLYALTSGPSSPEFSSFEPVATTNLVDPFTGNFTYNLPVIQIPGPDGGGYAMSLSYHSGASSEEEASWVGHGWTLNPGAINTSVRGNPDSYDNTEIDIYNKTRPNWTMSGLKKTNIEVFSASPDEGDRGGKGAADTNSDPESGSVYNKSQFGLNFSKYVRYNNYQGISKTSSIGLSKAGASLSMNRSETGVTFSATINPFRLFNQYKRTDITLIDKQKKQDPDNKEKTKNQDEDKKTTFKMSMSGGGYGRFNAASLFGLQTFTDVGQSVSLTKMKGMNVNLSYGLQINPLFIPVSVEQGYTGSFSVNHSIPHDTIQATGYLGSSDAERADHFTEKAQPFDKRDFFIGIPYSSPDNHSLSGEGLSGGFRAYSDGPRAFSNEQGSSKINTYGVGLEGMIGTNVGVGVNLSFGSNSSKMEKRSDLGGKTHSNIKYRFYGDLGGKVAFANNDIANVELNASPDFPGIKQVNKSVSDVNAFREDNTDVSMNASSFIKKKDEGGFEIHNETGIKYSYTEPVMVRNASSLSFGINGDNDDVENNYLAYAKTYLNNLYDVDDCLQDRVSGEVKKVPYENTSLLKLITTPDYIDLDPVGPDDSDFGGWTSFEYHKKYGEESEEDKWYRWRIPYNGLLYSKNSISDSKDDTGYVNTGEKEVNYLKKVETKTHVAYFVTNKSSASRFGDIGGAAKFLNGSGVDRNDGLGAPDLTETDPSSSSENKSHKGEDQLEYLEKIVLFSKARPETPLQVTNFRYDYSLVQNLPNNVEGNFPGNKTSNKSGKLTLKKVWSEFEGVVDARISSYKFGYQYSNNDEIDGSYSLSAQNPDYGPHLLDAWGFNQYDGVGSQNSASNRHLNLITWPYQGGIPESEFDPAAWQLKQIVLPSGGEILVEYESKDYLYVQDRDAMALVKLSNASNTYTDPTYTIDLSDIGGYSDGLCEKLNEYFLEGKPDSDNTDEVRERIYFKLLYALENNMPGLDNCKSEYITGYAKVKNIQCNGSEIQITLKGLTDPDNPNYVGDGLTDDPQPDENYRLTPRQACYDYYVTQRWGKYSAGCEGEFEKKYEDAIEQDLLECGDIGTTSLLKAIDALEYAQDGMKAIGDGKVDANFPRKENVCMRLDPSLSYLKIPINKAKRGGGVRVKKILMCDKGIGSGEAAIYGQEYKYELEDGRSSGVASNEPQEMREENPLVGFMPKKDQSWINRLIVGKDREQSEGPIGESLLPSPTVSHSRVVVENIHKGKTGTGYTVHEFITCKEYPYDKLYDYQLLEGDDRKFDFATNGPERGVSYTVLQDNMHNDRLNIPTPYFSYGFDKAWASQGFRFIQNSMHGVPRSVRTYGGTYVAGKTSYISSGQDFYYYEPGEKVRQLKAFDREYKGTYVWDVPGKEMDVTQEGYRIETKNLDFNFEIDVSAGLLFPPPIFVSFSLVFSYNEQFLTKYATSKVIKYPVLQKKVVSYTDNIASTTENLAFDYATGRPVLTKTYDAYHNITINNSNQKHDGSIYSLNIPAHWNYERMGQKSHEPEENTNQLLASSGQVITYGANANPINDDGTWSIKTDKVISAGANTYATLQNVSSWNNSSVQNVYGTLGSETVFRMHESYVFKGDVKRSSDRITAAGKIYEGGIIEDFDAFKYDGSNQGEKWVKLNEVTKYSPNGSSLEERDVLGIYSASKYGYNFTLPTMISKNSTYEEMYFEHFEDKASIETNLVKDIAHSGMYSKQITSGANLLKNVTAKNLLTKKGGWLKFWTKSDEKLIKPVVEINGIEFAPELMAKTGEWSLYRAFLPPETFSENQFVQAALFFENAEAYIDDIKFNPKEAQTTCYVYDVKSLRLLTLFDDQHFGLYYQYNGEGQLVRKQIETEKGLKIITETQYNLPKEYRDSF